MYVRTNSRRGLAALPYQFNLASVYPAWGPYGPQLSPTQIVSLQARFAEAQQAAAAATPPVQSTALVPAATPALPAPSTVAPATIQATAPSGATVTRSAGPPGSWPTNQPYTDAAGNVWNFDPQKGWQIGTPVSSVAAGGSDLISKAQGWLLSNSLISTLPNYGTVAIVVVGGIVLMKFMGGKKRR